MKRARIISMILLVIMIFISLDLGFNFLYNLVPEYLDGYTSHSTLQGLFGILGDSNWTLGRFFDMFENAVWITFWVLVENVVLAVVDLLKRSDHHAA